MLFILSGISFKSCELKVLCEIFSEINDDSNDEYDESINNEIAILKIFIKYHSKLKNIDSMDLFNDLLEKNDHYCSEYLLYLTMRFDLNFYNKITSKDLFNLNYFISQIWFKFSRTQNSGL